MFEYHILKFNELLIAFSTQVRQLLTWNFATVKYIKKS